MNAYCNGGALVAFRRAEDGHLVRQEFEAEHACFLRREDASERVLRLLRGSVHVAGIREEGEWTRIQWHGKEVLRRAVAKDGYFAQLGVETFEGDLDPVRRWQLDSRILIQRPRRCFLDFESDSRVTFRELHRMRVLCWSLADENGKTIARGLLEEDTDACERKLLTALVRALDGFDQIIAWNGDRFDFPLFYERARRLGVNAEWQRWLWLDHMVVFLRMNASASKSGDEKQFASLGKVAKTLLGEDKQIDLAEVANFSWKLWAGKVTRDEHPVIGLLTPRQQRELLAEYCDDDSAKMARIEGETGYLELHHTLCETNYVFPDSRSVGPKVRVEMFLMRLGHERGMRFATAHYREHLEGHEEFDGAFVLDLTRTGIVRDVHVCDFSRMYPSIILSWNMSPETVTDHRLIESEKARPSYLKHLPLARYPLPEGHCFAPGTNVVFKKEPMGLLALAVSEILRLRAHWDDVKTSLPFGTDEWKQADRRSSAYKIAANAFFGVVGSPFSRFYVREVAESIAQAGSHLLKAVVKEVESRGWEPISGDTDSAFVRGCSDEAFREFVKWCTAELFPKIAKEHGCGTCSVKLAYEKKFDRLVLMNAKKRYAGRIAHFKGTPANEDSEPEIKGLEYKRGDGARLGRRLQAQVIDMLLGGGVEGVRPKRVDYCEEDPQAFAALLDEWKKRVLESELARDDVVIAKKLGKPLKEYARKKKQDGTDAALPAHVEIALELERRGRDVGAGVRVEYVVVDGAAAPQVKIPAEDFTAGTAYDRFYLWEDLVFPPTQRVLEAAFPGQDWSRWSKARPPKPRGGAAKLEAAGQGTLFAAVAGELRGIALSLAPALVKQSFASPEAVKAALAGVKPGQAKGKAKPNPLQRKLF